MGIVLLTSIICTTIVYSAFNTELQINGEAILRSEQEIRITKITKLESSDGVIEPYNNKYTKGTTNMYLEFPPNTSITYEIEVTNSSTKDYDVSKILEVTKDNTNIEAAVSLKIGDIITKNSKKTFTIKLTNKTASQQVGTIVYQYNFVEHINSYVVEEYGTSKAYELTIPYTGEYKIELWGASGSAQTEDSVAGLGGYTSGTIELTEGTKLYFYVGSIGNWGSKFNSVHPDAPNSFSGGGATDVRISNGNWYDFDSLKSRIMVAAGGGGAEWIYATGGNAGGLVGYDGYGTNWQTTDKSIVTKGASQTSGGIFTGTGGDSGLFGMPGYSTTSTDYGGYGGSGYYGGASRDVANSGGGGSSFISGHNGCDAIKEESTSTNIIHTGQSIHYSGYKFTNTIMIDGSGYKWTNTKQSQIAMPKPDGTTYDLGIGHTGHGYAKITFIKRIFK